MSVSAIAALHLSTDYFFLPAVGYAGGYGAFYNGGTGGCYWSSSPYANTSNAYRLYFDSSSVGLNRAERLYGYSLRGGQ